MAIDLDAAIDRIQAILDAHTDPVFKRVYGGEPLAISPDMPCAAFWYVGDGAPPEGPQTLGNRMREERFTVRVYWPVYIDPRTLSNWEKEITSCKQALLAAFWGDVFLNGSASARVTDGMDISDVTSGYVRYGEEGRQVVRALSFDLHLRDLNAETEGA